MFVLLVNIFSVLSKLSPLPSNSQMAVLLPLIFQALFSLTTTFTSLMFFIYPILPLISFLSEN